MSDAPERIWTRDNYGIYEKLLFSDEKMEDTDTEYVRSDIAERQLAELKQEMYSILVTLEGIRMHYMPEHIGFNETLNKMQTALGDTNE